MTDFKAEVFKLATEFTDGNEKLAESVCTCPYRYFGGKSLYEAGRTAEGVEEVRDFLYRLAHGVFQ